MKELKFKDNTSIFVTDNSNEKTLALFYSSIENFVIDFKKFTKENLLEFSIDGVTFADRVLSDVNIIGNSEDDMLEVHYILTDYEALAQRNEIESLKSQIAELQEENIRYREGYDAYNVLSGGL